MKYFLKKLLGHEIFRSMFSWATKIFFEKFVKPSGPPSYILNVHSLMFVNKSVAIIYIAAEVFKTFFGRMLMINPNRKHPQTRR